MKKIVGLCLVYVFVLSISPAYATIKGHHIFYWYDDGVGGAMVGYNAPLPGLAGTELIIVEEWFVDVAQTTTWYGGGAVAGLPASPFAAAPVVVNNQDMYLYEIKNVTYGSGNGFSFSDPVPPGPGLNGLSGICMIHNPVFLNSGIPIANQFIDDAVAGQGLDLTPGLPLWQFQAFAGPGNAEWDITDLVGSGIVPGAANAGLLGYTVTANTTVDVLLDGWIHSWRGGGQVNIANAVQGFSGPIPEPATICLLGLGALAVMRKRRA